MIKTKAITITEFAFSAVLFLLGFIGYCAVHSYIKHHGETKELKKRSVLLLALAVIAAWFFIGTAVTSVSSGKAGMNVEFEMFSERVTLFGVSFAQTTVLTWIIMLIVLVFCLIFRFILFPRFDKDRPKNAFQNVMELAVEAMESFTKGAVGDYSEKLAPYMFSLAVFMVFSAASELFGCRPPTSDLLITLSMGLITFALINFYGVKKKGFGGRIKYLSSPTPVILPMKILSDVAVPISLACRLFGNMLGGMIVMDLLKSSLGGYAVGIPAVAGLYFLCITESFSVGKGDILVFLCALVFAVHILVIDHFAPKVDGVKMSCIQFFVCGILSVPFMFALEAPKITAVMTAWMPILYAGVLSCGVAYTLQILGQKNVNPAVASLLLSLESCFSVLAGWIVLGERLSIREMSGCILMFAAIILAQVPEKKKR